MEAQFGEAALTPIAKPKLPANLLTSSNTPDSPSAAKSDGDKSDEDMEGGEDTKMAKAEAKELEELHKMGIPVPGVEIRVDKMVAKVWLKDLEVECGNRVFGDRVRAVVERAVEVVAPLWG